MKALTSRRAKPGYNPTHTIPKMADDTRNLFANGIDDLDGIVCPLFLQVLLGEHHVFRRRIERGKEPLPFDELVDELHARYFPSRKAKSRSVDTTLVALGSRRGKNERELE